MHSDVRKNIADITIENLIEYPVWEFVNDDEESNGDHLVKPVDRLPVKDLFNRIVGTRIRLNNGQLFWAALSNIDFVDTRKTQHFLTLSIFNGNGCIFELARYFDVDYARRGPDELAKFIDLPIESVFPIKYDISNITDADKTISSGFIYAQPIEVLSEQDLINLSLT